MVSIVEKSNISELKDSKINLGNKLFLAGVFFLPSALPISAFFLLISLIISFSKKKILYFKRQMELSFIFIYWYYSL